VKWSLAYKGGQDKSLTDLSGGELDRVSLAVSLALSSTSSFPALLLDECFGALDATSRERCLDVLRRTLAHKPVLVIAHGETEGDYDTTINL
jgi:ABC-type Mn2+/Zn2+ transport system ATPase subunit